MEFKARLQQDIEMCKELTAAEAEAVSGGNDIFSDPTLKPINEPREVGPSGDYWITDEDIVAGNSDNWIYVGQGPISGQLICFDPKCLGKT